MTEQQTVTIELSKPIPYGEDQTINQLVLREPNMGDIKGSNLADLVKGDTDAISLLVSRISIEDQVTKRQLSALSVKDGIKIWNELSDFFID